MAKQFPSMAERHAARKKHLKRKTLLRKAAKIGRGPTATRSTPGWDASIEKELRDAGVSAAEIAFIRNSQ